MTALLRMRRDSLCVHITWVMVSEKNFTRCHKYFTITTTIRDLWYPEWFSLSVRVCLFERKKLRSWLKNLELGLPVRKYTNFLIRTLYLFLLFETSEKERESSFL